MSEHDEPEPAETEDEVEAHGLKEVAITGLSAAALIAGGGDAIAATTPGHAAATSKQAVHKIDAAHKGAAIATRTRCGRARPSTRTATDNAQQAVGRSDAEASRSTRREAGRPGRDLSRDAVAQARLRDAFAAPATRRRPVGGAARRPASSVPVRCAANASRLDGRSAPSLASSSRARACRRRCEPRPPSSRSRAAPRITGGIHDDLDDELLKGSAEPLNPVELEARAQRARHIEQSVQQQLREQRFPPSRRRHQPWGRQFLQRGCAIQDIDRTASSRDSRVPEAPGTFTLVAAHRIRRGRR